MEKLPDQERIRGICCIYRLLHIAKRTMKLYLSSWQLGDHPERLSALPGKNKHAAIVMNAGDVFGDAQRPQYLERYSSGLRTLGISSEELDLRKFFYKSHELGAKLAEFGMLWVVGGNTFTLRRAMRESGLDQSLPKLLKDSGIVYGGFSAGACVLAPSLRGIHLADEPEKVPQGYSKEVVWDGLGIVDFYIVPHFRSAHPESPAMEHVIAYYQKHQMRHFALADGQAIIVNESRIEIIGKPGH